MSQLGVRCHYHKDLDSEDGFVVLVILDVSLHILTLLRSVVDDSKFNVEHSHLLDLFETNMLANTHLCMFSSTSYQCS